MEDQHEDSEHGAQAEHVHEHGLDREDHRPGEQEQDDQRRGDDHRQHRGQVRAETVLEVEERGGLTSHADVDGRPYRTDVAHELLCRIAERPPCRGDGEHRIVGAGRLRAGDRGDVGQPVDPRRYRLDLRRAGGRAHDNLDG